jgi:hypothetical protein
MTIQIQPFSFGHGHFNDALSHNQTQVNFEMILIQAVSVNDSTLPTCSNSAVPTQCTIQSDL